MYSSITAHKLLVARRRAGPRAKVDLNFNIKNDVFLRVEKIYMLFGTPASYIKLRKQS